MKANINVDISNLETVKLRDSYSAATVHKLLAHEPNPYPTIEDLRLMDLHGQEQALLRPLGQWQAQSLNLALAQELAQFHLQENWQEEEPHPAQFLPQVKDLYLPHGCVNFESFPQLLCHQELPQNCGLPLNSGFQLQPRHQPIATQKDANPQCSPPLHPGQQSVKLVPKSQPPLHGQHVVVQPGSVPPEKVEFQSLMLQQEQISSTQVDQLPVDQLHQRSSSDKEVLGVGKKSNGFTHLGNSSQDTRYNKDLFSVSYSQPSQCREPSKRKAITESNNIKGKLTIWKAEGGEKINGSAPVPLMGSDLQAGKVSSTTTTQGKDEGKLEKWTDFVSKMSQSKPANRINERCLEKQSAEDNLLCPDRGGVGKDISKMTDRTLIDLSEVEIELDFKHLSRDVKDKVRRIEVEHICVEH